MRFISYTVTDTYYEFVGENGEKMLIPSTNVILVDDGNSITVKTTGGRATVGYLVK